jgi:hypothetical protein
LSVRSALLIWPVVSGPPDLPPAGAVDASVVGEESGVDDAVAADVPVALGRDVDEAIVPELQDVVASMATVRAAAAAPLIPKCMVVPHP